MDECIFCKISNGETPSKIIHENENFFSIPDKFPTVRGHSLVISKKHFENILDIPATSGQELLDCIKKTAAIIMKENNAEGFNVLNNNSGAAGQVVFHFHAHVVPRKKNDGIKNLSRD